VALHYLNGFSERYTRAVRTSEDLIAALSKRDGLSIDRIPSGTNLFHLRVRGTDAAAFQKRLAAQGIMLPAPQRDTFTVGVNETINRATAGDLAESFARALAG
jgi:threonine aldolase